MQTLESDLAAPAKYTNPKPLYPFRQAFDRPRFKQPSSSSATIIPPTKSSTSKLLSWLSIIIFLITALGGGFMFGVYPYVEARTIANNLNQTLPTAELAYQEVINSIQSIANYDLQNLNTADQVSQLRQTVNQLREDFPTLANLNATTATGSVAGARANTIYPEELVYSTEIEEQSHMSLSANQKLFKAKEINDQLINLENHGANLWVGEQLIDKIKKLTASSTTLISEAEAVVKFNDFSIILAKRNDDMLASINQAFLTGDWEIISQTLGSASTQMNQLNQSFNLLQKPQGSTDLYETVSQLLDVNAHFYNQLQRSISSNDFDLFVLATNQFMVDTSSSTNRFDDDLKNFWQQLKLGDLHQSWLNEKNTLIEFISTIENSPLYRIASIIPALF